MILFCPRLLETATAVKGRNFFAYADRVSWSHIRSFLGGVYSISGPQVIVFYGLCSHPLSSALWDIIVATHITQLHDWKASTSYLLFVIVRDGDAWSSWT